MRRREHDVRQRPVRRHDHRAADGDDVRRKLHVPAGARMEQPREPARRVVAHDQPHVVPARPQRLGLVLGVLDDAAPVAPRERHDDAHLHAYAAASTGASRAIPSSSTSSATASERRAQPAPLGPKPSPGAIATRCSARIRSGGEALRQPQPDVEAALADRRLGQRGDQPVAPPLVASPAAPRPSPAGRSARRSSPPGAARTSRRASGRPAG